MSTLRLQQALTDAGFHPNVIGQAPSVERSSRMIVRMRVRRRTFDRILVHAGSSIGGGVGVVAIAMVHSASRIPCNTVSRSGAWGAISKYLFNNRIALSLSLR